MQSNIFGSIAVELAGVRSVVSLQESKVIDEVLPLVKKGLYRLINACVTRCIKATVAVSHVFKYELVSRQFRSANGVEVKPLGILLPTGFDSVSFLFESRRSGVPLIGAVARLIKEKGIDRFIRTMPLVLKHALDANYVVPF